MHDIYIIKICDQINYNIMQLYYVGTDATTVFGRITFPKENVGKSFT